MQRYFALDNNLNLSHSDVHHVINVMRMKRNEKIKIVHNKKTYLCNIDSISENSIKVTPISEVEEENELMVDITIGMALVKESKFDLILQKATELGASSIIPLETDRSIVKINSDKESKKQERWMRICKEAAEQSHRSSIPKIESVLKIKDIDETKYDLRLLCSTSEKITNIKEILQNQRNYDKLLVVVGPEGGFTSKEENELTDKGFIKVSLGNRILRAETAPIFVLSILNYELMR